MRILALQPYDGGSHRAFLDGWQRHSRHDWTILGLPPRTWKWRMRHAAVTLAADAQRRSERGESWDVLFCSDMLNLAEFRGLCPSSVASLPSVAYFHENQLTYPLQAQDERDFHFAYTNFTTCLAAGAVWFNSAFHRDDYLTALEAALRRMPDYRSLESIASIRAKIQVQPPGVEDFPARKQRPPGPLRIVWAARWEHDKNPRDFFAALEQLESAGIEFRVSVIGEQFRDAPHEFAEYQRRHADRIDRWGFQPTRDDYQAALIEADVFASTAQHEFFGIAAAEAVAAGCYPLLPRRLAYPELLSRHPDPSPFFYNGSVKDLSAKLAMLSGKLSVGSTICAEQSPARESIAHLSWPLRAGEMDEAIEML